MKKSSFYLISAAAVFIFALGACVGVNKTSFDSWVMGFDASYVTMTEDKGGVYKYADGTPGDVFKILAGYKGMDYIRLRVWNNPKDGYDNKADLLKLAKRVHKAGMKIQLDFHYSDFWADPGKQNKPAAWEKMNLDQLKKAVHDYSADVVGALIAQGTPPDMVQIGNEVIHGILWPEGRVGADPEHWDQLAELINSGIAGVKSTGSKAEIMIHISEGGKENGLGRWFFDNLTARGVEFDLIGISYYPEWHGSLEVLDYNIRDLIARYKKPVIVVEMAYPFTTALKDETTEKIGKLYPGYEATPQGQKDYFRKVADTARAAGASGLFSWGGELIVYPLANKALFDYDGKALPALEVFNDK